MTNRRRLHQCAVIVPVIFALLICLYVDALASVRDSGIGRGSDRGNTTFLSTNSTGGNLPILEASWTNDNGNIVPTKIERSVDGTYWVEADNIDHLEIDDKKLNKLIIKHKYCENFWEGGETYRVHYNYDKAPENLSSVFKF